MDQLLSFFMPLFPSPKLCQSFTSQFHLLSLLVYSMSLTTYFNHIILAVLLCTSIFDPCNASESEIFCLRSIKDSMEDPYGYLASWNFTNLTEGFVCNFKGVECWHDDENRVLNIKLSDRGLKGQFPRGLENCTSLVGLDLSNNELYGPLPSDIYRIIQYVTQLDLSFNNFSGEIPAGIANCSFLNVLRLDQNRFVGVVPPELALLTRLKEFSVANNMLRGAVPTFLNLTVTRDNFTNNTGLCGYPLDPCNLHRRMRFDYSFKSGFMIGYIVFFVSVAVVSVSYCTPCVRVGSGNEMITIARMVTLILRRQRRKWNNKQNRGVESHVANSADPEICQEGKEISRLEKLATRLTYEEITEATNGFSENNVMGCGDSGTMYKGTLPNGCSIAVKRLNHAHFLEEQITSELMSLGVLRHPNLLPLLGFCITSDERLLVYKFMPNGSLYDWLHLHPLKKGQVLEWPVRVKIATGLARGLGWLHEKTDFRIIHLNVCSKSTLLDENFEPRLSNFNEAMIIRRKNKQFSTNSDDFDSGFWEMAFVKDDVYSFGIVLLELITGKEPCEMTSSEKGIDGGHPYEWVSNLLSSLPYNEYELIDLCLVGKGFDDEMFQFLQVGLDCVHPDPDQRPTMVQAYERLKSSESEIWPCL